VVVVVVVVVVEDGEGVGPLGEWCAAGEDPEGMNRNGWEDEAVVMIEREEEEEEEGDE
jgi:hypothetical protein